MYGFQALFQSAGQRPIEETRCENADPPDTCPHPDCRRLQLCCLSLIPSQNFLLPPLQLCRGQEAGLHRIHCLFLNFTGTDSFYICGHTK